MIDKEFNRFTYASEVGNLGCLVLVETKLNTGYNGVGEDSKTESSTITFVPGISMKLDCDNKIHLLPRL